MDRNPKRMGNSSSSQESVEKEGTELLREYNSFRGGKKRMSTHVSTA